ncbi:hypothetical protein KZP23_08500 [Echinicola marina]|uniref:hypothetical protein n=1 Tax=Echinicola marina TaxID=2859768 RepID=UPI001CF6D450|nr:hypothetical protein [Echinicola marina]UCS95034.1 hypothetical protein KZP23_08500 [Echinicola marina]
MEDKELDNFINILEQYKVKVSKSKSASRKFLVELGIVTEKGNLKKNYKHLCIPQEQA